MARRMQPLGTMETITFYLTCLGPTGVSLLVLAAGFWHGHCRRLRDEN